MLETKQKNYLNNRYYFNALLYPVISRFELFDTL